MGDLDSISSFLSNMGHNVMSATMVGRVSDYEETQSQQTYGTEEDPDISNWIPVDENSILEDLVDEDVYEHRNVGQRKKPSWSKEKCASCKAGFNSRSNPVKCDGCDKFTHMKHPVLKKYMRSHSFTAALCARKSP